MKGQQIDTRTKEKRIERCPNLLRVFTIQVLETAFFSDEKIFKVTQLLSVPNDRTYAPSAYKKSTIENKRLYVERSGFPMSLTVLGRLESESGLDSDSRPLFKGSDSYSESCPTRTREI